MNGFDHAQPGSAVPLIGISSYREQARFGLWDVPAVLLPDRYVGEITAAGGMPVLLPPVPGVEDVVSRLDGLLLSGGPDVDPARYGEHRIAQTQSAREDRDAAELALFAAALSLQVPVLGICRGMQLINVARGGSLHQHLPFVVGHDRHNPAPGTFDVHTVQVAADSRLAGILGHAEAGPAAQENVPTHHHQGIDRLGKGLTATAWADDGMVEAFELDSADDVFLVGVQWHPEAGDGSALFGALVAAAAQRASAAERRDG